MPEPFSAARIPAFRRKTLSWANVAAYLPAPQCPPSALGDYPADKLHNDSRPIADCVGSFDAASNCAAGSQRLRNVIQRPGRLNGTVETPVRKPACAAMEFFIHDTYFIVSPVAIAAVGIFVAVAVGLYLFRSGK
jgi:hypothetical protein